MFGAEEFQRQLRQMGYEATIHEGAMLTLPFCILLGKFSGTQVKLGFVVPGDFPLTCPSGPHISPALLPLHPQNDVPHPAGGVHPSADFERVAGGVWQYWSRPFPQWGAQNKSARAYLAFLNQLFATQ